MGAVGRATVERVARVATRRIVRVDTTRCRSLPGGRVGRNGDVTVDAPQTAREMVMEVFQRGQYRQPAASMSVPTYRARRLSGHRSPFRRFPPVAEHRTQYKWWQWDGITWSVLADWNASAALTWTPARAGRYTVMGWTRIRHHLYAFQPSYEVDYTIDPSGTPPPARSASLSVRSPILFSLVLRFNSRRRLVEDKLRTSSSGGCRAAVAGRCCATGARPPR